MNSSTLEQRKIDLRPDETLRDVSTVALPLPTSEFNGIVNANSDPASQRSQISIAYCAGFIDLAGVTGKRFFNALAEFTQDGFLDPDTGNRDLAAFYGHVYTEAQSDVANLLKIFRVINQANELKNGGMGLLLDEESQDRTLFDQDLQSDLLLDEQLSIGDQELPPALAAEFQYISFFEALARGAGVKSGPENDEEAIERMRVDTLEAKRLAQQKLEFGQVPRNGYISRLIRRASPEVCAEILNHSTLYDEEVIEDEQAQQVGELTETPSVASTDSTLGRLAVMEDQVYEPKTVVSLPPKPKLANSDPDLITGAVRVRERNRNYTVNFMSKG